MLHDLQKTDLYHSNQMNKCFEGDCFVVDIYRQTISTDKDIYNLLDDICVKEKLYPIGNSWRKLDYEHCKKLLSAALATDLAYGGARLGKKKVQKLMKIILDKVAKEDCCCFTNWIDDPWKDEGGRMWNGITQNTIDIAVVLLDKRRLVFTYAISED